MPVCEQAIPVSVQGVSSGPTNDFDVAAYLVLALVLFVGVPLMAWFAQRDDWRPRWAFRLAARLPGSLMVETAVGVALALALAITATRSPTDDHCLPVHLSALGAVVSCAGMWVFAWLLYRARRAAPMALLGRRSRWLNVAYSAAGLLCQANALLYFALVCGLLSTAPLVSTLGPLVYRTQSPLQLAPWLFALVELASLRGRPVAWTALRTTLLITLAVAAGLAGVGMNWPLSRVAEVLASGVLVLFALPLLVNSTPGVHDGTGTGYAPSAT